jgi:hypothetical protein
MKTLSPEKIKEIADELTMDSKVFIHKDTSKIVSYPNNDLFEFNDFDESDNPNPWEEDMEEVENNLDDYYEIKKWSSSDEFDVMKVFAENAISNNKLQTQLINALENKKPFRGFNYIIESAGDYKELWFKFRDKIHEKYVIDEFKRILVEESVLIL